MKFAIITLFLLVIIVLLYELLEDAWGNIRYFF